jgi:hypothetical protein
MSRQKVPKGWDAESIRRLVDRYDNMSDKELAADADAAASEQPEQTIISVPTKLMPAIRQLLATYKAS